MIKENKKLYVIFSILIAIFTFSIVNKTLQNDTFTAISIGNYILENGVDDTEPLTIHENLKFTKIRWAFDVMIASIYNVFGIKGIYIYTILISIILGLILFNVCEKINKNIIFSAFFTIITMYLLRGFLTARAQVISYIMFLLEIFFIEKMLNNNNIKYLIGIFIASVVIANFHASVWPMTLILFLPYVAEAICSKYGFFKKSEILICEKYNLKLIIFALIITSLSGFCSPLGLTPYTFMFKVMNGISKNFIAELQNVNIISTPEIILYIVFIMMLIITLKIKIKISDSCMICGLLIMGVMAYRNLAFFYIIAVICVERMITYYIISNSEEIKKITQKLSDNNLILTGISAFIIIISILNYSKIYYDDFINNEQYPVEATQYILENIDLNQMRIYNHFNYGSYLSYKGIPIFINSVSEIYCSEFNDTEILEDWYKCAICGKMNYNELFEKYDITHAILYKDEIINTYISCDENYKNIYEDDNFVIYEKIK